MRIKTGRPKSEKGPRRKSGVEYLAQHPGWETPSTRKSRLRKVMDTNPLRQTDSELSVLDSACTATEEILRPLLKFYSAESVANAFKEHLQIHLLEELTNIESHGHRNDDPNDAPTAPKKPYVLVTVYGGVAEIVKGSHQVDVEILDFDNLKDLVNIGETSPSDASIFLSDDEWAYLKEHDQELYEKCQRLKAK